MIRRSPAENYYKYLVSHPDCYDNKYIQDVAIELAFDYLGDWYLDWLRQRLRPPTPFYPEDDSHGPSLKFLLREQLDKAFNPDRAMQLAYRIIAKPRIRELVETMVLSRAPDHAIVRALSVRHRFTCSDRAVELYRHFFWNIELLDSTEMRALLDMRHHGLLAAQEREIQAQYTSIKRMRHMDPRMVAARLPTSPLAALLAQMELGIMPRDMDLAAVVELGVSIGSSRSVRCMLEGGPQNVQMAQGYAMVADIMNRLKESVVKPEEKLREDLQRISIATTPNKVPTIKELTGGQHTTNVHPEPKPEIEVAGETVDDDYEEEEDDDATE